MFESTLVTQFDNEPIDQHPDPNKRYYYLERSDLLTTGLTYIVKVVLLSKKHPELIDKIDSYRNDIHKSVDEGLNPLEICCANLHICSIYAAKKLIKNYKNSLHIDYFSIIRNSPGHAMDFNQYLNWNQLCGYEIDNTMCKTIMDIHAAIGGNHVKNKYHIKIARWLVKYGYEVHSKLDDSVVKHYIKMIECCRNDKKLVKLIVYKFKHMTQLMIELVKYFDKDLLLFWNTYCFLSHQLTKQIPKMRDRLYDKPNNINSLQTEVEFNKKQNKSYISSKLKFLF